MKRKPISKKQRFEIFKRDGFLCQYCGNTPPAVVLEVDHITPVSKRGTNDIDNLITSCYDCNRGKGANTLDRAPETVAKKTELLKEKEEQLKEYNKALSAKKRRETRLINEIEEVFDKRFDRVFTDSFRESIRHNFLPKLTKDQLIMAIYLACDKCIAPGNATKYFCGVCWNLIRRAEL